MYIYMYIYIYIYNAKTFQPLYKYINIYIYIYIYIRGSLRLVCAPSRRGQNPVVVNPGLGTCVFSWRANKS